MPSTHAANQNRHIPALIVLAVAASAFIVFSKQMEMRYIAFGFKHGVEDRRSGIRYATDAPGWKMVRSSREWTTGDKELVQRYMSSPIETGKRYGSAFMTGYRLGSASPVIWPAIVGAMILFLAAARSYRNRKLSVRH